MDVAAASCFCGNSRKREPQNTVWVSRFLSHIKNWWNELSISGQVIWCIWRKHLKMLILCEDYMWKIFYYLFFFFLVTPCFIYLTLHLPKATWIKSSCCLIPQSFLGGIWKKVKLSGQWWIGLYKTRRKTSFQSHTLCQIGASRAKMTETQQQISSWWPCVVCFSYLLSLLSHNEYSLQLISYCLSWKHAARRKGSAIT